jgi:hypothetical protein
MCEALGLDPETCSFSEFIDRQYVGSDAVCDAV